MRDNQVKLDADRLLGLSQVARVSNTGAPDARLLSKIGTETNGAPSVHSSAVKDWSRMLSKAGEVV